jgi:hypothetical protein
VPLLVYTARVLMEIACALPDLLGRCARIQFLVQTTVHNTAHAILERANVRLVGRELTAVRLLPARTTAATTADALEGSASVTLPGLAMIALQSCSVNSTATSTVYA